MAITIETVVAANRFGLGARPGDLVNIGDSPREWLIAQAQQAQPLLKGIGNLPTSKQAVVKQQAYRREVQQARRNGGDASQVNNVRALIQELRPMYEQHLAARLTQALKSDTPFYERLVHFWSNHFAVSADNPQTLGLVATLEVETIRPNISSSFSDMLRAVEQHPAMLTYLDNNLSIGPNSKLGSMAGRRAAQNNGTPRRKIDINENLAREIIELHTLGVDGGYTQQDVTSFAKVITGWGVGGGVGGNGSRNTRFDSGTPGEFYFNEALHEPGSQSLLGTNYKQKGIDQGEAVLNDLAHHPSTARHIATKLARHFIADNPPSVAVDRIAKAMTDSSGDLSTVYAALIDSGEAWEEPLAKYKTPNDFILSMYRAIDFSPRRIKQIAGPFTVLGQEPFRPGSPAGWPDTAQDWSGGEALFKRIEMAVQTGENIGSRKDPIELANSIMGPLVAENTMNAIKSAESGAQGIALLFASPEFMRR
jgi:uncharacterized protein (DUF1800 family)